MERPKAQFILHTLTITGVPVNSFIRLTYPSTVPVYVFVTKFFKNASASDLVLKMETWGEYEKDFGITFEKDHSVVLGAIFDSSKKAMLPGANVSFKPDDGTLRYLDADGKAVSGTQTITGGFIIQGLSLNTTYTISCSKPELNFEPIQLLNLNTPVLYLIIFYPIQ